MNRAGHSGSPYRGTPMVRARIGLHERPENLREGALLLSIVEALGNRWLTAQQLAEELGESDSNEIRSMLGKAKRRGLVRSRQPFLGSLKMQYQAT